MQAKKRKCPYLLISLVVGILVSILYGNGWLDRLEWIVYDLKFQLRGKTAVDKNIVIVAIDEQSLKDIGRWPWNRSCHTELINKLSRAGARTIALDVLLAEPERRRPVDDKKLIQATKASSRVVYLVACNFIDKKPEWLKPFPKLAQAAARLGHGELESPTDGVMRRVRMAREIKGERFYAFGLEIVRNYLGIGKIVELESSFALGNLRLPKRPMYINFVGSRYEQISYSRVLSGKFPSNYFKGKIVLVGATAKGMMDEKLTPFSKGIPTTSGIEIHANIVQTILEESYITLLNKFGIIVLILLLSLCTAILIQGLTRIRNEIMAITLMIANIAIVCFLAFYYLHLHLPFIPFAMVMLLVTISIIFWKIFLVERKLIEKILEFFNVVQKKEDMAEQVEAIAEFTERLKELDQLKSDLMSMVAHDFRTPLTVIKGYTALMIDGDTGTINETQQEFLKTIDESADRLLNLINDFLDVTKIESGSIEIKYIEFDLRELIVSVVKEFNEISRKKNISLQITDNRLQDRLLQIEADKDRIRQVLDNLISNAVKYTPENGHVFIEAGEAENKNICISIRDTGIGIPVEEQKKVFDKFFRTNIGQQFSSGTGLGLSIVKNIIDKHNGSISVESELGKGSKFTLCLPREKVS
ncbi:CHASE2 domain-containing protein [Candidatus Desantisbacteria bacterium]|nr:CHASE2 domain-containing protein [Candidatus Desantisbacteria bacterium]